VQPAKMTRIAIRKIFKTAPSRKVGSSDLVGIGPIAAIAY
jgi:hypothetical protein